MMSMTGSNESQKEASSQYSIKTLMKKKYIKCFLSCFILQICLILNLTALKIVLFNKSHEWILITETEEIL